MKRGLWILFWAGMMAVRGNAAEVRDYFVETVPDKREISIGEGVQVHYYFYSRGQFVDERIIMYPKLNGFIKRYFSKSTPMERVEIDGVNYYRFLKYAVQLYPLKSGSLLLDSLVVELEGPGTEGKITLSGNTVSLRVNPLPKGRLPKGFLGLMGKHQMDLSLAQKTYKVGEPIEMVLKIQGEGALENLAAPDFFPKETLELFGTRSNFHFDFNGFSQKTIYYTYLSKVPKVIPATEWTFSYFDLEKKSYEDMHVSVGPLVVEEGAPPPSGETASSLPDEKKPSPVPSHMEGPLFSRGNPHYAVMDILNGILATLFFGLLFYTLKKEFFPANPRKKELSSLIRNIRKNGPQYTSLFRIFRLLDKAEERGQNLPLEKVIEGLPLSEEARAYFLKLLIISKNISFNNKDFVKDFSFDRKFFKELKKIC